MKAKKPNVETYELTNGKKVKEIVEKYPKYKLMKMVGYAWKGKQPQHEDKSIKPAFIGTKLYPRTTFEQRWERFCSAYAAYDITIDHKAKMIEVNAFTDNDLH